MGSLQLNLADLGFTRELQARLDEIPSLLRALAALYIIVVIFSGFCLLFSVVRKYLRPPYTLLVSRINTAIALVAALMLLIGNIVVAVGANLAADNINEIGRPIGLSASIGKKFPIITWVAFALMVAVVAHQVYEFCQDVRARKVILKQRRYLYRF